MASITTCRVSRPAPHLWNMIPVQVSVLGERRALEHIFAQVSVLGLAEGLLKLFVRKHLSSRAARGPFCSRLGVCASHGAQTHEMAKDGERACSPGEQAAW